MTRIIRTEKRAGVHIAVDCTHCGIALGFTSGIGKAAINDIGGIGCIQRNRHFASAENKHTCIWCNESPTDSNLVLPLCFDCFAGPAGEAMRECHNRQLRQFETEPDPLSAFTDEEIEQAIRGGKDDLIADYYAGDIGALMEVLKICADAYGIRK